VKIATSLSWITSHSKEECDCYPLSATNTLLEAELRITYASPDKLGLWLSNDVIFKCCCY
jgi:hypothetical protein